MCSLATGAGWGKWLCADDPAERAEAIAFGRGYYQASRDTILTFDIPVYNNMPAEACPRPTKDGNPNTRLKSLSVDGALLTPTLDMQETAYYAAVGTAQVTVLAETVDAGAQVEGAGSFTLQEGENLLSLTVTAENGDRRTYTLSIYYGTPGALLPETEYTVADGTLSGVEPGTTLERFTEKLGPAETAGWELTDAEGNEKAAGSLIGTGDQLRLSAPNGALWACVTVVIRGDVNGDGNIKMTDLIRLRNHILGDDPLAGAYFAAADVTGDGSVKMTDLIRVRNHILGDDLIVQ